MILIKDRHIHSLLLHRLLRLILGKYDTYKGSTQLARIGIIKNRKRGNMILIKDRHSNEHPSGIQVFQGKYDTYKGSTQVI